MHKHYIVQPVILCGGSGTRLWPLSRVDFPKQFLCLSGKESLLQQAASRFLRVSDNSKLVRDPIVVTGEEHLFLVSQQLTAVGIKPLVMLLEPVARNTAPALTLAAFTLSEADEDPVLIVTPSDQTITDVDAFTLAISRAIPLAFEDAVVIFGIKPTQPEIGYGYIKVKKASENDGVCSVEKFVEKPDKVTALKFLEDESFFWNSGIFVLKASVWLKLLKRFRPDTYSMTLSAWKGKAREGIFIRLNRAKFERIKSESIDHAVIEHCSSKDIDIRMVELDANWDDVGAWDAVWNSLEKSSAGNVSRGDVVLRDTRDSLVYSSSRLVSVLGVRDLVVVETSDAVLVVNRAQSQEVKSIVNKLDGLGRKEHLAHRRIYRPWGWFDEIDQGQNFKVKRLNVNPKASLSLQRHLYRSEHWVVVRGVAKVTKGEETFLLYENQSTYISVGEIHRLENNEDAPLEVVEVQSGNYLSDDDIIRFKDSYGRIAGS